MDANGGNHAAENGGNHATAMEANGVAGNGGIPADQAVAQNGAVGNGGIPADQAVAQNGAAGNGGIPADQAGAQKGDVWNGDTPAPAMRCIPVEVLYQALLRLSAAELARGRTASRLWRDLTSTAAFRLDHHRHRYWTPMPLFFYRLDHQIAPFDPFQDPNLVCIDLRAVDIRARRSPPVIRFAHVDPALPIVDPRVFRIEGSCDGILLLSYDARLYACNPCTHHWARLPPLHVDRDIIGFYAFGPASQREYCMLYHEGYHDSDCRYWIFNLTFPELSGRYIGRPTISEAAELVLADGIIPSNEMPPVVVAGNLHWRPQAAQDNSYVLVFDTVSEVFRWIPPPRVQEDDHLVQVEGDQFLEINGRLAMILVAQSRVDVWVQDHIGEVWVHEYHIVGFDRG